MRVVAKGFAYITRSTELLVFEHVGIPEAWTQVPAGSIEPDETPERTALRESCEETGLHEDQLTVCCFLGDYQIDMQPYGKHEVHHRFVYHLTAHTGTPDCWQHYETKPSSGTDTSYLFTFYWVELRVQIPTLIGEHGRLLPKLLTHLDLK